MLAPVGPGTSTCTTTTAIATTPAISAITITNTSSGSRGISTLEIVVEHPADPPRVAVAAVYLAEPHVRVVPAHVARFGVSEHG